LKEGFYGVKTGITNNAGPCLASAVTVKAKDYIIIVLGSPSLQHRFKDTFKIYTALN